jgi:hypothetical protein
MHTACARNSIIRYHVYIQIHSGSLTNNESGTESIEMTVPQRVVLSREESFAEHYPVNRREDEVVRLPERTLARREQDVDLPHMHESQAIGRPRERRQRITPRQALKKIGKLTYSFYLCKPLIKIHYRCQSAKGNTLFQIFLKIKKRKRELTSPFA